MFIAALAEIFAGAEPTGPPSSLTYRSACLRALGDTRIIPLAPNLPVRWPAGGTLQIPAAALTYRSI